MKLPKKAKRVFKGILYDVYHWKQRMYDRSFATFEMLKRPDTVQVIPVQGNKIFMASQQQPHRAEKFYSFFGGRVEKGETPLTAAKRELLEESGLKSSKWELLEIYQPHSKIDWRVYYFIARGVQKKSLPKLDSGEKIKTLAFSFNSFMNLATSSDFHAGEFTADMLRLRLSRKKLAAFRHKLFHK